MAKGLKQIEFTTDDAWADAATATWTPIDDFLDEGYEPPTEEPVTVTYGDQTDEQQGVTMAMAFAAISAQLPDPEGGRHWFRLIPFAGTAQIVGGPRGARVTVAKSGIKKLGSGREYDMVRVTASGGGAEGTLKDDVAA